MKTTCVSSNSSNVGFGPEHRERDFVPSRAVMQDTGRIVDGQIFGKY